MIDRGTEDEERHYLWLLVFMAPVLLFVSGCGKGVSLDESLFYPVPSPAVAPLSAPPNPPPSVPSSLVSIPARQGKARPVMGVEIRGVKIKDKVIQLENGQRLSLASLMGLNLAVGCLGCVGGSLFAGMLLFCIVERLARH